MSYSRSEMKSQTVCVAYFTTVPGERVGLGWNSNACWNCQHCKSGNPQLCAKKELTIFSFGGFTEYLRSDFRFVIPLPRSIATDKAAPFMGAGITAFDAVESLVKDGMDVGLIGVGGIGHFVLKFASALNAKVTCFSHSTCKEDAVIDEWGGYHFVFVPESENSIPSGYKSVFDVVISTAPVDYNWNSVFRAVKPGGKVCVIGVSPNPMTYSEEYNVTFEGQRTLPFPEPNPIASSHPNSDAKPITVTYSNAGQPNQFQRMLEFATAKNILPSTTPLEFSHSSEAFVAMENNPHIRTVLMWSTAHL
jgi:uncharacterized zinc-type alcohol dehydrogenase-like protein